MSRSTMSSASSRRCARSGWSPHAAATAAIVAAILGLGSSAGPGAAGAESFVASLSAGASVEAVPSTTASPDEAASTETSAALPPSAGRGAGLASEASAVGLSAAKPLFSGGGTSSPLSSGAGAVVEAGSWSGETVARAAAALRSISVENSVSVFIAQASYTKAWRSARGELFRPPALPGLIAFGAPPKPKSQSIHKLL